MYNIGVFNIGVYNNGLFMDSGSGGGGTSPDIVGDVIRIIIGRRRH